MSSAWGKQRATEAPGPWGGRGELSPVPGLWGETRAVRDGDRPGGQRWQVTWGSWPRGAYVLGRGGQQMWKGTGSCNSYRFRSSDKESMSGDRRGNADLGQRCAGDRGKGLAEGIEGAETRQARGPSLQRLTLTRPPLGEPGAACHRACLWCGAG